MELGPPGLGLSGLKYSITGQQKYSVQKLTLTDGSVVDAF